MELGESNPSEWSAAKSLVSGGRRLDGGLVGVAAVSPAAEGLFTGRYPQPVALLARLGVALEHECHGLGAGLLQDVIARTHALGSEIGCRGLLVHAETSEARTFYEHLVPEFEASPTDPLHIFLLMKDIRRTLSGS